MTLGNRKFYDFDQTEIQSSTFETPESQTSDFADICQIVRSNIVGKDESFTGPFGRRQIVYCDYIASGRSLKLIEDYITSDVLPHYGNTHTTTSVTSLQTTMYRHEARDILR